MLEVYNTQRARQRRRHDVREVASVFCALLVSVVVGLLVGLPVVVSEDGIRSKHVSGKREMPQVNEFEFATKSASMDQMFMNWCKQVLGIETILEIQTFTYYDYMTSLIQQEESDYDNDDDDDYFEERDHTTKQQFSDPPPISVRGLAATRNIEVGEIVISTPLHALVTISTTIDQDPVLSRVMGPQARRRHGWILTPFSNSSGNNSGEDDYFEDASDELYRDYEDEDDDDDARSPAFYELPLLAVSLLYHRQLGTGSPLYPYIQILLRSPTQSMPFLWSKSQRSSVGHGVKVVAKSIRQEMIEMYKVVVQPLIQEHPDVFGKPQQNGTSWAFSYPNFQWAFAMVNSRHWELPIDDLDTDNDDTILNTPTGPSEPLSPTLDLDTTEGEQTPPAAMPTDAWIQKEQLENNVHSRDSHKSSSSSSPPPVRNPPKPNRHWVQPHSFLAPVADLLNFGPPCTRGQYNPAKHSFDIVASCPFTKGQEVTFWYSSECEHIIIGNYGFTHPMVPKCPTKEDYQEQEEIWKRRAGHLVDELTRVYKELDQMQRMFQHDCDCPCNPNNVNRHHGGEDDDGGTALGSDDDEPPARVRGSSHHFNPHQHDVDSISDDHRRRRIVDEADIERQKIRRERRSAL